MKAPSQNDRFVRVTAYMTDEEFGYDYWAARQFATPLGAYCRRPAVLILCYNEEEQAEALKYLQDRQQEKASERTAQ